MMFQLYVLVRHGLKTIWIQVALLCKGFAWREKDRGHGRAGGVACYIRNDLMYKRLNYMEVHDLEVMWMQLCQRKRHENSHVYW